MSPGATVRFAKATIHRVEVGPGRRFLPVKRKSKSTLTYISPLDPGAQKSAPKTMLQSPTKLRRHQENQAAMGRYWLRTEEEEARERAEAERRAEEEAERYRNEPASPPPTGGAPLGAASEKEAVGEGGKSTLVDKVAGIDKLSLLDSGPALDKVEEELAESESEDSGSEAGAKCHQEEEVEAVVLEKRPVGQGTEGVRVEAGEAAGEAKESDAQAKPSSSVSAGSQSASPASEQVEPEVPGRKTTTTPTSQQSMSQQEAATTTTPSLKTTEPSTPEDTKLAESRSFFERLAEKQAAEERAARIPSPIHPTSPLEQPTTKPTTDTFIRARSSSISLSKEKSKPPPTQASSSRSSSTSINSISNSRSKSTEQLVRTTSREKEKEKEKHKDKEPEKFKEGKPRTVSSTSSASFKSTTTTTTVNLKSGAGDRTQQPKTYSASSSSRTGHSSSSGSNHLHLRRGRRYFEGHKQGIMA
jgi:hypothetical protein